MSKHSHKPAISRVANDQRVKAFNLSKSSKIFKPEELSQLSSLPISPVYSQMVIKLVKKINHKADKISKSPQRVQDSSAVSDIDAYALKALKEKTRETLNNASPTRDFRITHGFGNSRGSPQGSTTKIPYQLKKGEKFLAKRETPARKTSFSKTEEPSFGFGAYFDQTQSDMELNSFLDTVKKNRTQSLAERLKMGQSPTHGSISRGPGSVNESPRSALNSSQSQSRYQMSTKFVDRTIETSEQKLRRFTGSLGNEKAPYGYFGRESPSNTLPFAKKGGVSVELHQKLYTRGTSEKKLSTKHGHVVMSTQDEEESDLENSFLIPRIEVKMKPKTKDVHRPATSSALGKSQIKTSSATETGLSTGLVSLYGGNWKRMGSPMTRSTGGESLQTLSLKQARSQSVFDPMKRTLGTSSASKMGLIEKHSSSTHFYDPRSTTASSPSDARLLSDPYFALASQVSLSKIPKPRKMFTPIIKGDSKVLQSNQGSRGSSAVGGDRKRSMQSTASQEDSLRIFQNSFVQSRGRFL